MLKKNDYTSKSLIYGIVLVFFMLTSVTAGAMEQYPYFDPQKGYGIENDARPWFDGKDYPFFREMYNGKSLKPQEEGSYQNFPKKIRSCESCLG